MVDPEKVDGLGEQAGRGGEDEVDHPDEHDDRDEVRRVRHHLCETLEAGVLYLVDGQRQDQRRRRPNDQGVDAQRKGIANDDRKIWRLYELAELGEADPGAAEHALHRVVVAEGDLRPDHGPIVEGDEEREGHGDHKIELSVPADPCSAPASRRLQRRGLGATSRGCAGLDGGSVGPGERRRGGGKLDLGHLGPGSAGCLVGKEACRWFGGAGGESWHTRGAMRSRSCGPRSCRLKAKQVHLATSFPLLLLPLVSQ